MRLDLGSLINGTLFFRLRGAWVMILGAGVPFDHLGVGGGVGPFPAGPMP